MKKLVLLTAVLCGAMAAFAQTDSTINKMDTIKIGGMIIIRRAGDNHRTHDSTIVIKRHHKDANLTTNWWIVDLGFANYNDQTDYTSAAAQQFAPGGSKDRFNLRNGKSVNVGIWIFMQKLNMVKHVVNFKYGLGLDLNNYRFDDTHVLFEKNPTKVMYSTSGNILKNKLAADYITVPALINLNFTPQRKRGFGLSAGISAGYLYSARQKLKDGGKQKIHDDFDLRQWKLSYIGELNLGLVRLYGSYAFKSMWDKGLDQTPYTVGIRFSSW